MMLAVIIIPLLLLCGVITPINSSSLSEWSPWSVCTRSCDGGVRYRKLRMRYDLRIDLQSCNTIACFSGESQQQGVKVGSEVDQVVSQFDIKTLFKQFLASKAGLSSTVEFEIKKLKIQHKLSSDSKQTNTRKIQLSVLKTPPTGRGQPQKGIILTKYKPPKAKVGLKIPRFISNIHRKPPKANVEMKIVRKTKNKIHSNLPGNNFKNKIFMKSKGKIHGKPYRSKVQRKILQKLKGEIYGKVGAPKSTATHTIKNNNSRKKMKFKQTVAMTSNRNLAKVSATKMPPVKTNKDTPRLSLKKHNLKATLHSKLKASPGKSNRIQANGVGTKYSIESALTAIEFTHVHLYDIDASDLKIKRAVPDTVPRNQIDAVLTSSHHLLVVGAFSSSIGFLLLVWALKACYKRRCTDEDKCTDMSIA